MPLPASLRHLIEAPRYAARTSAFKKEIIVPAGVTGLPRQAPLAPLLHALFDRIVSDAESRGIAWGEWLALSTAALFALNAPDSLRAMMRYAVRHEDNLRPLAERVNRACLMREVGLKCLGLIGTPRTINNLAALRAEVDADQELAAAMPTAPRRDIHPEMWERVTQAGYGLWDDVYGKKSEKLRQVLTHSHPDLGLYIIQQEYGPLFSPPPAYHDGMTMPPWEVHRLRTSLVAISALHAQGGVAPQVTSHIYGLLRAQKAMAHVQGPERRGLDFLMTMDGAQWVIETVNEVRRCIAYVQICRVVDGSEDAEREPAPARL